MRTIIMILLMILSLQVQGQYFNYLYDGDSSADMGNHIVANPDNTFLFYGGGGYGPSNQFLFFTQHVSSDGSQVLDKHVFKSPYYSYYRGYTGRLKKATGGYVCGVTAQAPTNHPNFFSSSQAILTKFNNLGDTIFFRSYSDTNKNWDQTLDCLEMPDGNYLLAGSRESLTSQDTTPAILWKASSGGSLVWEKQYQWQTGQFFTKFNSIEVLDNNRILAGISTSFIVWTSPVWFYYREQPKFIILDTSGNVLRDTVYGNRYAGGASVFKDINGGYFHYGLIDSLLDTTYPDEPANFPPYLAHLDSNFRIDWLTMFSTPLGIGKDIWAVKQLHDSNYLLIGDFSDYPTHLAGWVCKVDKNGSVVWDNIYQDYPQNDIYLEDAVETPEHNIVLIGGAKDNNLPPWRQDDAWILGVDSNGCEITGCTPSPTAAKQVTANSERVNIYPNPTGGSFTVETAKAATLQLYNLQGQPVGSYDIVPGKNQLILPQWLPGGIYIGRLLCRDGSLQAIRLMYQP